MNTGALFVAVPTDADPINQLSEEDVAHITLTYFGEFDKLPADLVEDLIEAADEVAAGHGPFTAQVAGTGVIGPDKAGVLILESVELVAIRNAMLALESVQEAQQMAERQFPWWIPHLTVVYGKPLPDEIPETIEFDRIGFWQAGQKDSWPLVQAQSPVQISAALSIPTISSVNDLPLGLKYADSVPDARWYVTKRASALGAADQIPGHWRSA